MKVVVYSYTQIKCTGCNGITAIAPGTYDTSDIFKLNCGCDKPKPAQKVNNGKQTKKDSEES